MREAYVQQWMHCGRYDDDDDGTISFTFEIKENYLHNRSSSYDISIIIFPKLSDYFVLLKRLLFSFVEILSICMHLGYLLINLFRSIILILQCICDFIIQR